MSEKHCCKEMEYHLHNDEICLWYSPRERFYGIFYKEGYGGGVQTIHYCPWCGIKLPKDLTDELWECFEQIGIDDLDDPKIPDEFKTDEWWRKRGL